MSANTSIEVASGGSSQSRIGVGDGQRRGVLGCAGAAGSLVGVRHQCLHMSSHSLASWVRAAAATPAAPSTMLTTVTVTRSETPLVVSMLLAHRRFAVLFSSTITTQSSAVDAASALSTSSCGASGDALTALPPSGC